MDVLHPPGVSSHCLPNSSGQPFLDVVAYPIGTDSRKIKIELEKARTNDSALVRDFRTKVKGFIIRRTRAGEHMGGPPSHGYTLL